MADAFEKALGKGVGLVVDQVPYLPTVVDVFRAFLPDGADARFQKAVEDEAQSLIWDLHRRVGIIEAQLKNEGKRLDEPGVAQTFAIVRSVAQAFPGSFSDAKREAVVNAAVRQFDPRLGSQQSRKYWLDRVIALTDLEVHVPQLLSQHTCLVYLRNSGALLTGCRRASGSASDR